MQKLETPLKDLYILQLKRLRDSRGWFSESYSKLRFEELGFVYDFVQDNHSKSVKNVVRGLHFQKITNPYYGQAKLVRCTKGKVWDVAVDIEKILQRTNNGSELSLQKIIIRCLWSQLALHMAFRY